MKLTLQTKLLSFLFTFMLVTNVIKAQDVEYLTEDFSGTFPPTGWTIDGVANQWAQSQTSLAGGTAPEAKLTWVQQNTSTYLISPEVDLTGVTNVVFSFKHLLDDYDSSGYTIGVATRSGSAGAWNTVWSVSPSANIGPETVTLALTGGDVGSANFQIAIFMTGNLYNFDFWYIDDISMYKPANLDLAVNYLNTSEILAQGNNDITTTVLNMGLTDITGFDISYSIDGGSSITESVSGISISPTDEYTYTFSNQWTATAGNHSIEISVSNVNGGNDDVPSNNTNSFTVMVLNEIFDHNVVYEEGTGTWCGWCVRGIVGLKDMYHYHGDGSFIGIAVHNGDPMVVTEYDNSLGISSFPSGKINRKSTSVDPGYDELEPKYLAEKDITPVAKIEITNMTWDANTRELTADVSSIFALDIPNANYNASLIIVEDGVSGTSSGYAQGNYYSGNYHLTDWEGTDYYNLPNPIPATQMVYDHVGRDLVGGFDGVAGSIPSSVTYNTPNNYTFSYTMPSTINEHHVKLVAIIIDNNSGEIVNGYEADFSTVSGSDSIDQFLVANNINVFPNPASDMINITGAENMNIAIYDVLGNMILEKNIDNENVKISLDNFINGMYFIKFNKDNQSGTMKFIVNK